VLVIRRIRVTYRLKTDPANLEAAQRAHDVHHAKCPVYRTLAGCIDISTELTLLPEA
jgi:uncharacterized OsmC-like protein